jgi:hypothetical protein
MCRQKGSRGCLCGGNRQSMDVALDFFDGTPDAVTIVNLYNNRDFFRLISDTGLP